MDIYSSETPDLEKFISFTDIIKILQTGSNDEIAEILSPGIEIYHKDEALFFTKSLKKEIKSDDSNIFKTIKELVKGLEKIDTSDPSSYEENMRISLEQSTKVVSKIKTGHIIKEIVFEYLNGKYVIWEILAD